MPNIKIDCVIGTRPEAIKMAPVILALMTDTRFKVRVVATGQHTDMLDQALSYFHLRADENLKIMKDRQTLDHITSAVQEGVGRVLDEDRPDAVLVHGDTTTTFSAALAAFYRGIPVGHVEAGLRSHDLKHPFPEEMNRLLTDRISTWWFAPTQFAKENLLRDGIDSKNIVVTGNTVVDALRYTVEHTYQPQNDALRFLGDGEDFILMTAHRRESWGEPMERICQALKRILDQHPTMKAVVPMHKNPLVREIMERQMGSHDRICLCEPLDYPDFVWCMANCRLIMSDSGGVQEEATALGRPVLILREVTERPEAVEHGSGLLVGTDEERMVFCASELLSDADKYQKLVQKCKTNPFGDGKASDRIVERLGLDLGDGSDGI